MYPRFELTTRLRRTLDTYRAQLDQDILDQQTIDSFEGSITAITMDLNADAPIARESASLSRDDPYYGIVQNQLAQFARNQEVLMITVQDIQDANNELRHY